MIAGTNLYNDPQATQNRQVAKVHQSTHDWHSVS